MAGIDSGRIARSHTQRIDAAPDRVFPLLCPVREGEWLDGWAGDCQLIHSRSGVAEDGCVFRTGGGERPETVWVITKHDPVARVVEFVRVTTGLVATRLNIRVEANGAEASLVHVAYTHTPTSSDGVAFVAQAHSEEAFRGAMVWWQDSMNHWLRTGEMLRH